jgi:hypothetical protein
MRVLLDECVSEGLRNYLAGHECQNTRYARFAGLGNGQLLTAAEAARFDVLLAESTKSGVAPWICYRKESRRSVTDR